MQVDSLQKIIIMAYIFAIKDFTKNKILRLWSLYSCIHVIRIFQ